MKEINCICGERIVFLDPDVEIKTCPNCGMPVRQYPLSMDEMRPPRKGIRISVISKRTVYGVGLFVLLLAAAAVVGTMAAARRGALEEADASVEEGRAAEARGEYNTASAAYQRALKAYSRWNQEPEIIGAVMASLARVESRLQDGRYPDGEESVDLLAISLEEIAKHAYDSLPGTFERVFDREYAGREVFLMGNVEQRTGSAYKASALTLSYRVFSSSGGRVELAFDGPFLERYRVKEGDRCIISAVLDRMYLDPGSPGEAGHWVIVFDGTESAFVTETSGLKGLGWEVDDEIEDLVASQRLLSPAY